MPVTYQPWLVLLDRDGDPGSLCGPGPVSEIGGAAACGGACCCGRGVLARGLIWTMHSSACWRRALRSTTALTLLSFLVCVIVAPQSAISSAAHAHPADTVTA